MYCRLIMYTGTLLSFSFILCLYNAFLFCASLFYSILQHVDFALWKPELCAAPRRSEIPLRSLTESRVSLFLHASIFLYP